MTELLNAKVVLGRLQGKFSEDGPENARQSQELERTLEETVEAIKQALEDHEARITALEP